MVAQPYRSDPSYPLKEWDVITKIGDTPIDSDGKVAIRYDLRLSASYLVQKLAKNGVLPITVFRDGEFIRTRSSGANPARISHSLSDGSQSRDFLSSDRLFSRKPRKTISSGWATNVAARPSVERPTRWLRGASTSPPSKMKSWSLSPRRCFPIASPKATTILIAPCSAKLTDTKVKNLRHLVEILRDNRDEQFSFKFASGGMLTHETMVFNRTDLMKRQAKSSKRMAFAIPLHRTCAQSGKRRLPRTAGAPPKPTVARHRSPLIDLAQRVEPCRDLSAKMKLAEQYFTSLGFC